MQGEDFRIYRRERTWYGVRDADVRQTHLPTTIAGGCAGFLSQDEPSPVDPRREPRPVIT